MRDNEFNSLTVRTLLIYPVSVAASVHLNSQLVARFQSEICELDSIEKFFELVPNQTMSSRVQSHLTQIL